MWFLLDLFAQCIQFLFEPREIARQQAIGNCAECVDVPSLNVGFKKLFGLSQLFRACVERVIIESKSTDSPKPTLAYVADPKAGIVLASADENVAGLQATVNDP